jgi:ferredoxin
MKQVLWLQRGKVVADMTTRLVVDRDLCESNGVCVRTAPEMFVIDDSDKMRLLVEQPSPEQMDKAQAAVRRCPKRALSLVDE